MPVPAWAPPAPTRPAGVPPSAVPAGLPPAAPPAFGGGLGMPMMVVPPRQQIRTARTSTGPEFAPGMMEAERNLQDIRGEKLRLEARRTEIIKQQADLAAEGAAKERAVKQQEAIEQAELREDVTTDIGDAEAHHEEAVEAHAGMEMRDFMSSRTEAQKSAIYWGIALGGFAAAAAGRGGRNTALDIFNRAVDMDFKRQKEQIAKAKDEVNMAITGINNAEQAAERRQADLAAKFSALHLTQAEDALARGASATTEQAKLAADIAYQDQLAQAEQKKRDFLKETTKQSVKRNVFKRFAPPGGVPGVPGAPAAPGAVPAGVADKYAPPPGPWISESTGKVAKPAEKAADGYAMRMVEQYNIIKNLKGMSDEGAATIRKIAQFERIMGEGFAGGIREALPEGLGGGTIEQRLGAHDRSVYNALQEFGAANLRLESGAAISAGEMVSQMQRISRVPGDTDADVRAKERSAENQIMSVAGQSWRPSFWRGHIGRGPQPPAAAPAALAAAPQAPIPFQLAPVQPPAADQSADIQAMIDWVRKNPNHPKTKARRALIRQLRGK